MAVLAAVASDREPVPRLRMSKEPASWRSTFLVTGSPVIGD